MTTKHKIQESEAVVIQRKKERKAHNTKPIERGLGPDGGGWNIAQASRWSGIGEATLREMAKRGEVPCLRIGRRIVITRQGFKDWFNRRANGSAA
jgi:hypothetical protein